MMERPVPIPCSLDRPFWTAAAEDRLVVQRSKTSGQWQTYSRAHSLSEPMRNGEDLAFEPVRGTGVVETFSIVHRSFYPAISAPYAFAVVRLDEGVLLTTHIVETPLEQIRIGMPVEVTFVALSPEIKLPCFRAVGETEVA
jgi:uncharacterized OB-fold protein